MSNEIMKIGPLRTLQKQKIKTIIFECKDGYEMYTLCEEARKIYIRNTYNSLK